MNTYLKFQMNFPWGGGGVGVGGAMVLYNVDWDAAVKCNINDL